MEASGAGSSAGGAGSSDGGAGLSISMSDVIDSDVLDADVSMNGDELYELVQVLVTQAETETDLREILAAFTAEDNFEVREQAIAMWAMTDQAAARLHLTVVHPLEAALHNNETWLQWLERQCRRYTTPPSSGQGSPRDAPGAPQRSNQYRSLGNLQTVPEEYAAYRSLAVN